MDGLPIQDAQQANNNNTLDNNLTDFDEATFAVDDGLSFDVNDNTSFDNTTTQVPTQPNLPPTFNNITTTEDPAEPDPQLESILNASAAELTNRLISSAAPPSTPLPSSSTKKKSTTKNRVSLADPEDTYTPSRKRATPAKKQKTTPSTTSSKKKQKKNGRLSRGGADGESEDEEWTPPAAKGNSRGKRKTKTPKKVSKAKVFDESDSEDEETDSGVREDQAVAREEGARETVEEEEPSLTGLCLPNCAIPTTRRREMIQCSGGGCQTPTTLASASEAGLPAEGGSWYHLVCVGLKRRPDRLAPDDEGEEGWERKMWFCRKCRGGLGDAVDKDGVWIEGDDKRDGSGGGGGREVKALEATWLKRANSHPE